MYLLLAMVASLAGDVLLMLPGDHFIAGLAAFLLAHVAYLALFRQGVGWFPSRVALTATLLAGALMLGVLWPGLQGPLLTAAVAVYVLVIALMTAQALGRAAVLGDAASRATAWGAAIFMLSDAVLGVDRFVQPVPLAPLWVLGSYFMAQILILHNTQPCPTRFEPEGGAYFQREMSLSGESEGGREWVDHRKDGDQHGRIKAVND